MKRADLIFRPFERPWENPTGDNYRSHPRFSATYSETTDLLRREVAHLGAKEVVIQLDATEHQIRNDGFLRSDAKIEFPGVRVNIESRHGPLVYATDEFKQGSIWRSGRGSITIPGWHSNLRAIALSLEALRKVDRYGVSKHGEQYRGWNALPPGTPMPAAKMTYEQACTWLQLDPMDGISKGNIKEHYRLLSKEHHPDHGGDPEMFHQLAEARDLLLATL